METKVMTPEEFEKAMQDIAEREGDDPEKDHEEIDEAMCNILWELGYSRGIEIICNIPKLYA